jgi:hypothetical protein
LRSRIGNWLTFVLWVAIVVTWALAVLDAQLPLATDKDRAQSQLAISLDGTEFTFRGVAPNSLKIRVEPAAGTFGRTVTFTVGDVRDGLVIKR